MKVNVDRKNGVTVLRPHGKMDDGGTSVLEQSIYKTLSYSDNAPKMLIDFDDVARVRNTGLMMLKQALMAIKRKGGRIGVINVGSHVKNPIVIINVVRDFERFDSEKEALSALAS